jgi:hypothetical protein
MVALALPITTETADNRICYRTPLLTTSCTPDHIEGVTGPIEDYATEAKPTLFQCYRLLKSEWLWVTYWFGQLFPAFEGPAPLAYTQLGFIKQILKLWILQFGPAEMTTWTDIKAAMNGAGEDWQDYLAWIDSDPGFTLDAGTTVHLFPEKLLASLQASSGSKTANSAEVKFSFNIASKVCDNVSCSPAVKGYCFQANKSSACAQS